MAGVDASFLSSVELLYPHNTIYDSTPFPVDHFFFCFYLQTPSLSSSSFSVILSTRIHHYAARLVLPSAPSYFPFPLLHPPTHPPSTHGSCIQRNANDSPGSTHYSAISLSKLIIVLHHALSLQTPDLISFTHSLPHF